MRNLKRTHWEQSKSKKNPIPPTLPPKKKKNPANKNQGKELGACWVLKLGFRVLVNDECHGF
jgi:hypothetical protein